MMLIATTFVLAKGDSEMRFIFIAVAAAIWIIGEIAKAVKRAGGAEPTVRDSLQRTRDAIEQDRQLLAQQQQRRRPVRLAPGIARRVPPMFPKKIQQPRRPIPALRAAPMPPMPRRANQPPRAQAVVAAQVARAATEQTPPAQSPTSSKPSPKVNAPALHTWLRPATLRQQFILTEIFQPPLVLRTENRS